MDNLQSNTILSISLFVFVVLLTWGLLFVRDRVVPEIPSTWSSTRYLDIQLKYQLLTLVLIAIFLLLCRWLKPQEFVTYFRIGNIDAPTNANPLLGIKAGESWRVIGGRFAVIITSVTAAIIYFQKFKGNALSISPILFWTPLLAASNAFVEEALVRFGVVVSLSGLMRPNRIAVASGLVFGTVHYFGTPGGSVGVTVAGLLGWLLARSVLETKGLFLAWFIHFLQDLVIMGVLLLI